MFWPSHHKNSIYKFCIANGTSTHTQTAYIHASIRIHSFIQDDDMQHFLAITQAIATKLVGTLEVVLALKGSTSGSSERATRRNIGIIKQFIRLHPNLNNGDGNTLHTTSNNLELIAFVTGVYTRILAHHWVKILQIDWSRRIPLFLNLECNLGRATIHNDEWIPIKSRTTNHINGLHILLACIVFGMLRHPTSVGSMN